MPKIILASRSHARQKILKDVGIKFSVIVSGVAEEKTIKKDVKTLVTNNAKKKASDVAKRIDSGIIISADTVVLVGKKLVGKPKNKKDAFNIIKLLSSKPHFVYSGLAVIDKKSNKMYMAHDKTKVYMKKMSDVEIRKYVNEYKPMDKAGAFDIQGPGGMLVERIEGCFYNVVGLPLSRLVRILKKIDKNIF